jgi:hypothetical protein
MDMALGLRTMVIPSSNEDALYSYNGADSRREWTVHLQVRERAGWAGVEECMWAAGRGKQQEKEGRWTLLWVNVWVVQEGQEGGHRDKGVALAYTPLTHFEHHLLAVHTFRAALRHLFTSHLYTQINPHLPSYTLPHAHPHFTSITQSTPPPPPPHFQAGAGLVADSVPEAEYEETLNKAAALGRAIDLAEAAFVPGGCSSSSSSAASS